MNAGIERTIDCISAENHPMACQAKDAANAAVAMTALAGGVAWVVLMG